MLHSALCPPKLIYDRPEPCIDVSADSSSAGASFPVADEQPACSPSVGLDLPVIDLSPFLQRSISDAEVFRLSQQIADSLHKTSCLIVRDPRVGIDDSDEFLDMLERYFAQSLQAKLADSRPQLHYQVGSTPEGVELPKCVMDPAMQQAIAAQPTAHRATLPQGPDCKWRFMWRLGPRPAQTSYAELNSPAIIPAGFPNWEHTMNSWGTKMLAAVEAVAELAANGLGLPAAAFTSLMEQGPHLLAPTGCNLEEYGRVGTCIAGFHYDLNFLTIHGRARFPGLFIWLRDGTRVAVKMPAGCLLLQAGKQLEWLTGGHIRAGMHEVLCTQATVRAMNEAKAAGRSLWRVSSTVFGHVASDRILVPLGPFALQPGAASQYPQVAAGAQVQQELDAIRLSSNTARPQ
ncbi:hypothetical protein WJX73_010774 [Symbiochloris irregularis]|uniref:Uncharacterized protein n=1 Tax=Symbiochloris irregularis TaxID=706552 RepID=A0AAW1NX90_9CHLO